MKSTHPRITLLGNNSGRNLGDAAILSSILEDCTQELPDAEFYVPSIAPEFIDDNYGDKYNVKGVNVMPWTGSLRLLGIPTIRCLWKSDVAFICDGIIFGHKFFSPHNFLLTLIFIVPIARLLGCKMVCYNTGIGPFPIKISEWCAKVVINLCDLVVMRDKDGEKLAREIGVTVPILVHGDVAFTNKISSPERGAEVARAEGLDPNTPILGINVTPYIDSWLKKNERLSNKEAFLSYVAKGILGAQEQIAQQSGVKPQLAIFSCSPMDEKYCFDLANQIGAKVIHNSTYLSHDIQAVMRRCELLVGMRFHSLVLTSSTGTPIVGLVYAPKVRGIMRLLKSEEYQIELADVSPEHLATQVVHAWNNREALRRKQQAVVAELRSTARKTATLIREKFYPKHAAPKQSAAVG